MTCASARGFYYEDKWHLSSTHCKETIHMSKFCLIHCRYDPAFFSFFYFFFEWTVVRNDTSQFILQEKETKECAKFLMRIAQCERERERKWASERDEDKTYIRCVNNQHSIWKIVPLNEPCYHNRRHVIWVENRCKWNRNIHAHNFHLGLKGNNK